VKSATVSLALLVALLLLLPAPAVAAPLTIPQQADQADAPPATPTPEVTPEPTPEPTPEAEVSSPVTDLHATAGRLRGRVEVGWSVSSSVQGAGQEGTVFVVERSTNGSSWRPVKACYVPFDGEVQGYGCTDSRLASGATYAYRVCLAGKATSCSNALTTDPVSVKAP
jgi:hypothetical protein